MQQDNIYRLPYNPLSMYIYTWQKYFKQANSSNEQDVQEEFELTT